MTMCWQKSDKYTHKANLYGRVKKLLESYEWSDCSFIVSQRNFKAHKLILAISSPVFEAMLYGPLSSSDNIEIIDIEADTFQLILNYIYTDAVEITDVEQAFELLYASRKYMLEHLTDICISHIKSHISIDNVIEILNYPEFMQDKQLISVALKLFCEHADYLFEEKKNLMAHSCLKIVLESNIMNINEKDLIKHVLEWCSNICEQKNIPNTIENRRELLNKYGILKLMRFTALSTYGFKEIVSSVNNVLLPSEIEDIADNIECIKSTNDRDVLHAMDLVALQRCFIIIDWLLCYRSPIRPVAPVAIDSNNCMIQTRFKVNKSLFINSLIIPTRSLPADHLYKKYSNFYSEELTVIIQNEESDKTKKKVNFLQGAVYDSTVEIPLRGSYFLKRNESYKISFKWSPNIPACSYPVEVRHDVYRWQQVAFEFDDLPFNVSPNGSFLIGLKFCL